MKEARLRLERVPRFQVSWLTISGSTQISIGATNPGFYMGGVQLELGTFADSTPLVPASSSSIEHVNLIDKGTGMDKQVVIEMFDVSLYTVMTASGSTAFQLGYVDNAPHELQINLASNFGTFFHNFNINAMLDIQDIPQSFDFTSDFATMLKYTANSGISSISAGGTLDDGMHGVGNALFLATGLPADVDLSLDPRTHGTLSVSDASTHIGFM